MHLPKPVDRIFISYAHDSAEHSQLVLEYSDFLNNPGGLDCWIDQYMEGADMPEGWPRWMRQMVSLSKHVIVICSPKYLARMNGDEENGKGLGAKFESTLILTEYYQSDSMNKKFIPVVTVRDHISSIPDILQDQTHYVLSEPESKWALYLKLTGRQKHKKPEVSSSIMIDNPDIKAESGNCLETSLESSEQINIPVIPQYLVMKPGTKILQTFFSLPVVRRFKIANDLGLVEQGESIESANQDKLGAKFLERAYAKNLMAQLWSQLFDENIDPNPFKK